MSGVKRWMCVCCVLASASLSARTLPVATYRERMIAGWIGQIAGVVWGPRSLSFAA